ncbi:MAG: IS66 family insertion sequence element accessory protein TnpB [Deltaproteobacteria bacterium]
MIPVGVDIYLGTQPVDLRWGVDRLCGVITERVGRRPRSGAIFVFFGKRRHCSVPLPSRHLRARDSGVSCTDGMSHAA